MNKRGLCRHAVSVRLSVRPSVSLSRSWILSKRININVMAIFRRPPPLPPVTEVSNVGWVGNNRDSRREYLVIGSMTGGVRTITATVDRAVYGTDRHASVNLIYHSQQGRPGRREQNRTEQNLIVRSRAIIHGSDTQRQIWSGSN